MSADQPAIDREQVPMPAEGLTVRDVRPARACYADRLGGPMVMEKNRCIVRFADRWVIINPGGGLTRDEPDVELAPHEATGLVDGRLADQARAGRQTGRADGR